MISILVSLIAIFDHYVREIVGATCPNSSINSWHAGERRLGGRLMTAMVQGCIGVAKRKGVMGKPLTRPRKTCFGTNIT